MESHQSRPVPQASASPRTISTPVSPFLPPPALLPPASHTLSYLSDRRASAPWWCHLCRPVKKGEHSERGRGCHCPGHAWPGLLGQLGTQQEAEVEQASCEVTVPAEHIWTECVLGQRAAVQESSGKLVRVEGVEATLQSLLSGATGQWSA